MKKENIKGYEYFEEYKDNPEITILTAYGIVDMDEIYNYIKKNKHLDKSEKNKKHTDMK